MPARDAGTGWSSVFAALRRDMLENLNPDPNRNLNRKLVNLYPAPLFYKSPLFEPYSAADSATELSSGFLSGLC